MNKSLSILLTILFFQLSSAQVGIGTASPSPSSALDIKSSNSGLLIPRVSLISTTDNTTISSPETSLLVYNLSSSNDITPGFYYWEGSWKTLKGGSTATTSTGWNLTGNTTTSTDFLGTLNSNPLLFKVNNADFGKFHPSGGITIGKLATANDTNGVAIGTSSKVTAQNGTAIGYLAEATQDATALGYGSKASYQSVAIGLNSATIGNTAIAIGSSAKTTAENSVSIGTTSQAAQQSTAVGNISKATGYISSAFGNDSGATAQNTLAVGNGAKATGYQSIALGNGATSSAQNATAIGLSAVANVDNTIIIGTSNNKTGIGTSAPDERLHVLGNAKIVGSAIIVDGTQANNYVLTSDNNGKGTWQNPNANKAYAEISASNNMPLQTGGITFNTVGQNANMNAVTTTGIKIKTPGVYKITYSLSLSRDNVADTVTSNFSFFLYNGQNEMGQTRVYGTATNGNTANVSFTKLVYLNVDQTVSVRSDTTNPNINILANSANLVVELVK